MYLPGAGTSAVVLLPLRLTLEVSTAAATEDWECLHHTLDQGLGLEPGGCPLPA